LKAAWFQPLEPYKVKDWFQILVLLANSTCTATNSRCEDELVFPALEDKDELHNVSHSYTLDHEHEAGTYKLTHSLKAPGFNP
jgi:hypothetical protein